MDKVLITGAGGFIGSHLTEKCVELGYKVKALIHYNSKNNWGWLEKSPFKKEIEIINGDICDFESVQNALKGCNGILHLAALISIPYSYNAPLSYIKTNIEGTYNILQASRKLDIANIVITSTSEVYGTAQYTPIDELHPLIGQSPYSATKIGADQLGISFYSAYNLPVKIIRPFNTYGPRQSARAIIPTIITQLLTKNQIKLGDLTTSRDLTYVADTVDGFIEIFKLKKYYGEVFNVGMNHEILIKDLALLIAKIINKKVSIIIEKKRLRPDKSEVRKLVCNNQKIQKFTNWKPKYDLEKGLTKTVEWIKKNINTYKEELYNL